MKMAYKEDHGKRQHVEFGSSIKASFSGDQEAMGSW